MTELSLVQKKAVTINEFIHKDGVVSQLNAALPKFLNADRFLRTIYSALLQNPKLLDCSKESLLSSMIQAAQLGLEPVLGKAALIPYGTEMQFQPMFRGLIDLAMRSDKIEKITAHTVYDKDAFAIDYGTAERLTHNPFLDGDRGNIRGSYTVWYYKDGGTTHSYMSISDIYKIRDRSQAWKAYLKYKKTCPWNTDESEMCKKTVIKRHSKLQPCSVEFETAVEYDNALESGVAIIPNASALPATKAELLTDKIKAATPAQDLIDRMAAGDNEIEGFTDLKVEQVDWEAEEKSCEQGEDETKPTVDSLTGEVLGQDEPSGLLPDGVDAIEWLIGCRPSSSLSNAKAFIAVYEEQKDKIEALDDKIRGQVTRKLAKTKVHLAELDARKQEMAEEETHAFTPPPFEIEPENHTNEYDANGRLQFITKMRKYMDKDGVKYKAVLDSNNLGGMNDVKVGDEQVILGFMSMEFGE